MYYPYLRAKGEEINCLLGVNQQVFIENTTPIIEPIGISKSNLSNIKKLATKNIPFVLIVNPQAKKLEMTTVIEEYLNGILKEYDNFSIAYIIHNNSTQAELNRFNRLRGYEKFIIHKYNYADVNYINNLEVEQHIFQDNKVSKNYIKNINSKNKIILLDGFNRLDRNADYPDDSFFSDIHYNYKQLGYIAVSDYLTQGDVFSETGGPAYAVAIHLSVAYDKEIYLHHFISDNREGNSRTAEKFAEALTHLIDFITNTDITETTATEHYRQLHDNQHFPGLGVNKRYSLMNHIEQVSSIV